MLITSISTVKSALNFSVNKISPCYYDSVDLNVCEALLIFDIACFYVYVDDMFVYILLVSLSFYSSTYHKILQVT